MGGLGWFAHCGVPLCWPPGMSVAWKVFGANDLHAYFGRHRRCDSAAGLLSLNEFQEIADRTARLLRPVLGLLRADRNQHDRHFVVGQSEFTGDRFRVEPDDRRRTQTERVGRIDQRGRANRTCAQRFVALALRMAGVQTAC